MSKSLFEPKRFKLGCKMTKIEVELIPDPDMSIFCKKGTIFFNRYSKANNKYLKS